MGRIYLRLEKAYFEKHKAEAAKAYDEMVKESYSEAEEKQYLGKGYLFNLDDLEKQNIETDEGSFSIDLSSNDDDEAAFLSVTYHLDPEDYIELAALAIKRMNKAKALFETLQ